MVRIAPKIFLVHFVSFFVYVLLHLMSYAPRFCQMKDLKIYICDKFHQYSICGCEIKIFQTFWYWFSIHETLSWVFLALFPQNIVQFCWNFDQRWSPISVWKDSVWKILQNFEFNSNGRHRKFTVLFHFGAQFTAGKPKILLKTKVSAKTTFLGISNSISPRSQKITEFLEN